MENMLKPRNLWRQASQVAQPDPEELLPLIAGEWTDAATYLSLSRSLPGRNGEALRRLFQEEQAHAACLKGIYTLMTGRKPLVRAPGPRQEAAEITLRRCYGREMQSLAAYEARREDREYGPVFARLAEQERQHCRTVLEILGSLQPTP